MDKKDIKIVFFGTPEFAAESLRKLVDNGFDIAAVVTAPDKPAGRGHRLLQSDVKKEALLHDLPVLQPRNLKDPAFIDELKAIGADLFIVIAFRMLPEAVWQMPPMGCFNLHASLLPAYRGAAPINRAIINGETRTGVTTFFLKHEIDTGDILAREEIEIGPDENVGSVYDRLMRLGADMTCRTVESIADGSLHPIPQPDGEYVPAPKIFRPDCEIDWNASARQIHNLVRGLSPYPCARTTVVEKSGRPIEAKIISTRITDEMPDDLADAAPGTVSATRKHLVVKTGDGVIEILSLQPSGKKPMEASAFLLGYAPDSCRTSDF
ncbi:MAG: methionyl-tRNA formyltransferase [Muribaculaceae bacterium]|nr:methionyl-tRNA formyltransferase [Muribaculaceae bacterium]